MFVIFQYCVPQILLSRWVGKLARCRIKWLKNAFIGWFIRHYHVNMQQALQSDYRQYECFHDFFIRRLASDARPIDRDPSIVLSPVDGFISQIGQIQKGNLLQAKKQQYSLLALLGNDAQLSRLLDSGLFLTAYLSPKDYHRVHMPYAGQLMRMRYVPGHLFSVNPTSVNAIPNLFTRNERLICYFHTAFGPMVMVLVGAMIVGNIQVIWHGPVNTPRLAQVSTWHYQDQSIHLGKGEEMGFFTLGSTVILLLPKQTAQWLAHLKAHSGLNMGQAIARLPPAKSVVAKPHWQAVTNER